MSKIYRSPVDKELIRQIRKYSHNFLRRIKRIEAKYGNTSHAVVMYKNSKYYKENPNFNVRGLSRNQLQKMLKDIKYFNALKTSTVKGLKRWEKMMSDMHRIYTNLGPDAFNKINVLYNKLVEENRFWEKYKYEIRDAIEYCMNEGMHDEEIIEFISRRLNELYDTMEDEYITMEDIVRI